ncbi:hypothetical protein ZIOFF_069495 [Zingiber officinale]|uniref:Uncharacterized protein n=1 Tax=Zingiber officinale TaxID=94328 RepID=A0A8J5EPY7_ZINOF|nr:hypothetical protein ZIOFF_069495 [Zingiber officinale]
MPLSPRVKILDVPCPNSLLLPLAKQQRPLLPPWNFSSSPLPKQQPPSSSLRDEASSSRHPDEASSSRGSSSLRDEASSSLHPHPSATKQAAASKQAATSILIPPRRNKQQPPSSSLRDRPRSVKDDYEYSFSFGTLVQVQDGMKIQGEFYKAVLAIIGFDIIALCRQKLVQALNIVNGWTPCLSSKCVFEKGFQGSLETPISLPSWLTEEDINC